MSCLSDSAWVGGVEFVEGFAPSHGALSFDEAYGLVGALAGFVPPGGALAGPFVLDVDDRQPQQLDDGVVGGEVAAGLGDLAQLVVQRLDAVGGVQQLAHARAERQERGEALPGVFPDPGGLGVFASMSDSVFAGMDCVSAGSQAHSVLHDLNVFSRTDGCGCVVSATGVGCLHDSGGQLMDTSSWIALVSALIAALAALVSGRSLRLQRGQAATSVRQEFDDLVRQLWLALGKSFGEAANSRPGVSEASRAADSAVGEIQTMALRADEILHPDTKDDRELRWHRRLWHIWRSPDERPHPSWFDAGVLATSFAEVWDLERARTYWDLAVRLASGPDTKEAAMAQVLTLRELGAFYYIDSTDSGLRKARDAFNKAVNILQPEAHGTDRAYYQNATTLFMQAQLEDSLDNTELASQCICKAWELGANIKVFWRRQQARYDIASFVATLQSDTSDPTRTGRYDDLPESILLEAQKLRIQQQAPVMPWLEQSGAAQQPAFIPPPPMFVPPPPPGSVHGAEARHFSEPSTPPETRSKFD